MLDVTETAPSRFAAFFNPTAVAHLGRIVKTRLRIVAAETVAEPVESPTPVTGVATGRNQELAVAKARVRWLELVEQTHGPEAADLARARFCSVRIETDGAGYLCLFRATPGRPKP